MRGPLVDADWETCCAGHGVQARRYGAYTELFAALSPDVTPAHSGSFILPWGRFGTVPDHIEESMKPPADGGKSLLEKFIAYCERATTAFR